MEDIGISFLVIVFGLVEFAKKLKLEGNSLVLLSMALGILFGVGYQVSLMYPEVGVWFRVVIYGLAVGLAACGLYDFTTARLPKV